MKRIIIAMFVLALAFVVTSCDGESSSGSVWDAVSKKPEVSVPQIYKITGKVTCSLCRSYDSMLINVESEDGSYLMKTPWTGDFGDGEYKIDEVLLNPDSKIFVRFSEGRVRPDGKGVEAVVPGDNDNAIVVNVSLP